MYILYNRKFLRDKIFEVFTDFDLSLKTKTQNLMLIYLSLVKEVVSQKCICKKFAKICPSKIYRIF